ncbi:MAG TPA: T9SS type A sorting domain-containing protein [Bacteroidetes bacterium]|nr:T9SS type A sorting domain-containing protein [Bacteroidota bacterium]
MKKDSRHPILVLVLLAFLYWNCSNEPAISPQGEEGFSSKNLPHEWMFAQRAYPDNHFDKTAINDAYRITQLAKEAARNRNEEEWEPVGPTNIGGRITDIALHPTDQGIIYAGTSVGGIFKTTDGGDNWEVVFEDEGAISIGNIALAPSSPNVVYAGSGEANGSATSGAFFGDGIYKSTDGGENWEYKGLENSQHIGRIAIDPANADRAYVAAMGTLYGKNEERGLYRTLDGGDNWEKVLYLSDSTGCIDVALNPQNADIVYAATWERIRMPWQRRYGGATSRIYRSFDGGDNWELLTDGLPQSNESTGKIGLAISPSEPNILYACYTTNVITNQFDGIYKSTDAGTSWQRIDDGSIDNVFSSFGWFFGNLRVNPLTSDDLYCLGLIAARSLDGGMSWDNVTSNMHVDFHALEIHPQNPDFIVAGNDGGLYISQNGGADWAHVKGIANNMLYNCEIDQLQPERIFAGAQDQGTIRTPTGSTDDFEKILGGDGFQVLVDPTDNNFVFAEFQFGNLYRSEFGGDNMEFIFNADPQDRTNWNTPILLAPDNPTTIYYGAQRLYRSTDRGDNFMPISNDLTDGQHPSGSFSYGTITTIAVAPSDPQTIYVGTDDGNVQVTFSGGDNWQNISEGLPDRYVTQVATSPTDPLTAYVTLSGYRSIDYLPHVLTTTDGGEHWSDISANLPEIPINDIIVHPDFPGLLFIANDMGVWFSENNGGEWKILGTNMPFTVVNDLDLHADEAFLLAATFGRSMLKYDISTLGAVPTKEQLSFQRSLNIYPNPVLGFTKIIFEMPRGEKGKIEVFNLNGSLLKTMADQYFLQGKNEVEIDFSGLPSGMYLVRLAAGGLVFTKKVVKN